MTDLLVFMEAVIALLVAGGGYLILRGFLPIVMRWHQRDAVWHMASGVFFFLGPIALRLAYWAYAPLEVRQMLGKSGPNVLTGVVVLYGIFLLLKLQWLIIPEHDRHRWSIFSAPWYPHEKAWRLSILVGLIRRRKDP